MEKTKINTIDIRGKKYATVDSRVEFFREKFPTWSLETEYPVLDLERGVCVCRAVVKDEVGRVVAQGTAHEWQSKPGSMVNKTSFVENCVPLSTQILTRNGWKFYHQLKVGDDVLSFNMTTGKNEFCKLLAINLHKDRPLINMRSSRFNITCTSGHKWVVSQQNKRLQKIETQNLKVSDKIMQTIPQVYLPSNMGKRLGWLMCDCEIDYRDGLASHAEIHQSKPAQIKKIEKLFGKGVPCKVYNKKWLQSYRWNIGAETVRQILGYFGMNSYKDLAVAMLNADINDVAGCYESMMLADGSNRGFSTSYRELVDAVQIMATRLGIATTFITERLAPNSTKPIYTLSIKKTTGAYVSELKTKKLPPHDVWCPTTENGTWFMRQGTFVTLTSNCETSAVGRALGFLGIGINGLGIATAEEVSAACNHADTNDSAPNVPPAPQTINDVVGDEIPAMFPGATIVPTTTRTAAHPDDWMTPAAFGGVAAKINSVPELQDLLNAQRGNPNIKKLAEIASARKAEIIATTGA